jgi:hypothetical protein
MAAMKDTTTPRLFEEPEKPKHKTRRHPDDAMQSGIAARPWTLAEISEHMRKGLEARNAQIEKDTQAAQARPESQPMNRPPAAERANAEIELEQTMLHLSDAGTTFEALRTTHRWTPEMTSTLEELHKRLADFGLGLTKLSQQREAMLECLITSDKPQDTARTP